MVIVPADASRQESHLVQRSRGMLHGADDKTQPPQEFLGRKGWEMPAERLTVTGQHGLEFVRQKLFQKRQRLNQAAAEQTPRMCPWALRDCEKPEQGFSQKAEDHGGWNRLTFRFRLGRRQSGQASLVDGLDSSAQNFEIEALFVAMMIVDRRQVDLGIACYLPKGRSVVAMLCKQRLSSYYYLVQGFWVEFRFQWKR